MATYSCDTGYGLTGDATSTCGGDDSSPNGVWSGTPPTCDRKLNKTMFHVQLYQICLFLLQLLHALPFPHPTMGKSAMTLLPRILLEQLPRTPAIPERLLQGMLPEWCGFMGPGKRVYGCVEWNSPDLRK